MPEGGNVATGEYVGIRGTQLLVSYYTNVDLQAGANRKGYLRFNTNGNDGDTAVNSISIAENSAL
ncbi:hypothetical protein GCM10010987_63780 [Bradyrhizobium guangdongense]|uniref:Uncharacterized protein n=1 Tax=Bradyrhizobium guangdongense TaxID=1325090 RepID=A0AA88BBG8_9BRAD|nr:hypothetical protein GCM10010987_63780 [Bradyrhizobium guangdongense]